MVEALTDSNRGPLPCQGLPRQCHVGREAGVPITGSNVARAVPGQGDLASLRMSRVKYVVNVTGETLAQELYDSFDQAKKRVRDLEPSQFPATICEMPPGEAPPGAPRVVSKYRVAPP
jgi:hypothetical protein